jgi:hypothetical protein
LATASGVQALRRAKALHRHLGPAAEPSMAVYGAAMGVALHDPSWLWEADPEFAHAAGLPHVMSTTNLDGHLIESGGGCGGGGCGDGGECGG